MKYRIYIDEVGNHDLKSSNTPGNRYLSLTGVIIDLDHVKTIIHPEMENIKSTFFQSHPDEPLIFHRKEILNAKHPFEALRDNEVREKFDHVLLKKLAEWEYSVITVCLDKKKHLETYKTWRYDPYHYCLAMIVERYTFFLEQQAAKGDVMAESRGGKEDKRLKDSFTKLWTDGTDYVEASRFQSAFTSKQLKVKPKSSNVSGLQLADLIAHPSRNEILDIKGKLDKPLAPFASHIVKILVDKYYKSEQQVYGRKFI